MIHRRLGQRAVTPVAAVVLLVGLTVVFGTVVSAATLAHADGLVEPVPTVTQSSGEYDRYAGSGGRYTEQVIRITHVAGDTLTVSDIEIVVDASDACGKVGRLVNLPATGDDPRPTSRYVRGDDVFDNAANSVTGPIGAGNGEWSAGERAQFRLAASDCDLSRGDSITVRIIHKPTQSVLIEHTMQVR